MMKRDLKQFKYVGGAKVENKPYENKFNRRANYLQRDIDSSRLNNWEVVRPLTERTPINDCHLESQSYIKYPEGKKLNVEKDQFINQNQEPTFKPSLKHIEVQNSKSAYENNFYKPKKQRETFKISEETDIFNQAQTLLPHMRTKTPTGRPITNTYKVQVHSKELDEYNQRVWLPHMRTATPNNRQYGPPQQHIVSNQTDFINQKKQLMPSFQNITKYQVQNPNEQHKSQFNLNWE